MDHFIKETIKHINRNNMSAYYAEDKAEALKIVEDLIPKGAKIANGGSMSLEEIGFISLAKSGDYEYIDRMDPSLTKEQRIEMMKKSFFADVYLSSSNAVTTKGELYNVDGNGNRIAALAYGPESVIIVVGRNKIVPDLASAVKRVKTISAPLNSKRLKLNTYCAHKGHCASVERNNCEDICSGCESEDRICSSTLILGRQRIKNRIKVVIVNDNLGY